MVEIVTGSISALALVLVAVIETVNVRSRKRTEARAARRAEESKLSMEMMSAVCGLSMDTAKALRDGHTNGTLRGNLERAERAQENYENFLQETTAKAVSKI